MTQSTRPLFHKDGRQAKVGDKVTSFRGEVYSLSGWPDDGRNRVWVKTEGGKGDEEYFPSVFDLSWEIEFDNDQAGREGWAIFECGDSANGRWQIQRCDEEGIFADDNEAWKHVAEKALAGSDYHKNAIAFIRENNITEYTAFIEFTKYSES